MVGNTGNEQRVISGRSVCEAVQREASAGLISVLSGVRPGFHGLATSRFSPSAILHSPRDSSHAVSGGEGGEIKDRRDIKHLKESSQHPDARLRETRRACHWPALLRRAPPAPGPPGGRSS